MHENHNLNLKHSPIDLSTLNKDQRRSTTASMAEPSPTHDGHPLLIYFIPFPSPGHIIPMLDIADAFAARGANTNVVLSPLAAARFCGTTTAASPPGRRFKLCVIPFPAAEVGLPPGHETVDDLPSRSMGVRFALAVDLLRAPFDRLVRYHQPDAIVSDALLPWTAAVAESVGAPLYVFPGTGCFALSVGRSLRLNRSQDRVASDSERFLVAGLPDAIYLTRSKLVEATTSEFVVDRAWGTEAADRVTAGWVVNTFPGLEQGYLEHYERETGKRVFAVGPVCLLANREAAAEESPETEQIEQWLDSKPTRSVVYVCFGSMTWFPQAQVREIAQGLEDSGVPFLWAVGGGAPAMGMSTLKELQQRVEDKGKVVTGWVPQRTLLCHAAIGGFLTHCGWGSTTEAAAMGVPVATWPVFGEQFYNEEVVVGVGKWGTAVGAEKGFRWEEDAKEEEKEEMVVVGRRRIAETVVSLMIGGECDELRRMAKDMREKATRVVAAGGTSDCAVSDMMDDIRRRRSRRSGAKVL